MKSGFAQDHKDYLLQEYQLRKSRRALYSQRAFARDLDLAASSLTDFLKDRIRFTEDRVAVIGKKLGLSNEQMIHWSDLMDLQFTQNPEKKSLAKVRVKARLKAASHSISNDEFQIVSEWFYFAILELIDMNSKKYSAPNVLAKSLGLPLKTIKVAIRRLLKLNLIVHLENGLLKTVPETIVGENTPSSAIRNFHFQVLSKAQKAIDSQKFEERFLSSTFVGLTQENRKKLQQELQSTALKLLEKYSTVSNSDSEVDSETQKTKLYCLSFQFFNLLNEQDKK